jgi:hypothetical protein
MPIAVIHVMGVKKKLSAERLAADVLESSVIYAVAARMIAMRVPSTVRYARTILYQIMRS